MGVKNLSQLLDESMKTRITYKSLDGKVVGFDAFIQLFQFISSIRDEKGISLTDSDGNVTSHLVGLVNRISNLMQENIKPVFIFDGKSHELKSLEQDKRREARKLAEKSYQEALAAGDMERAAMFARRVNILTPEMVADAKELLDAMGIPIVQAPGEGEAQAAQMTAEGAVDIAGSQDYDTLLFGSPLLVRNLTRSRTRRTASGIVQIYPELYRLDDIRRSLDLNQEQMIDMGILMGTDFNPGFKGVGPKTAYKFIKKYGDFETVRKNEEKISAVEIDYEVVRDIFLKPNVNKNVAVDLDKPFDLDRIYEFLRGKNFNTERYSRTLEKTRKIIDNRDAQSNIDDWF